MYMTESRILRTLIETASDFQTVVPLVHMESLALIIPSAGAARSEVKAGFPVRTLEFQGLLVSGMPVSKRPFLFSFLYLSDIISSLAVAAQESSNPTRFFNRSYEHHLLYSRASLSDFSKDLSVP
jgi:hypothetical protein